MSITVRYFASLAEEIGRREDQLAPGGVATVAQVWDAATGERAMPANVLSAVNHEYVDRDHAVRDGDEVAFFPPVTGG
jgi:molybdopterin synthase sulfur carrier subunit